MAISLISSADRKICSYLSRVHPVILLLAIPSAQLAIKLIGRLYEEGEAKEDKNLAIRALFLIPSIRKKYEQKLQEQRIEFQKSKLEKWEKFGKPFREIPEKGMSFDELVELILLYAKATSAPLEGQHLSGAIYFPSLIDEPIQLPPIPDDLSPQEKEAAELHRLYLLAMALSYLWNPLHGKEFAVGSFIHFQLIQMIGRLYGGQPDEIAGFVTSGGTESLMVAAKGYVEWGIREKGLKQEECVILAPDTIHAGLDKAQADLKFQLVKIPTDENGNVRIDELYYLTNKYQSRIVAYFCSTPNYPTGHMDPFAVMGREAKKLNFGMHVDNCLGSFFDIYCNPQYLTFDGVTSISTDPHKGGSAPKGVSVLITQKMPIGHNLAFYPIYSFPDWLGGIYGTPTKAGSQSCVAAFTALLALLKRGKEGYEQMGKKVRETAIAMGNIIKSQVALKLLGEVDAHVVAFKIDEEMGYEKGAIYGFTKLMEDHGFTCSNIAKEAAHFCVTERSVSDQNLLERFETAVLKSLIELAKLDNLKKTKGIEYPGEAGLYGEIGAAISPQINQLPKSKYLENLLFGKLGAKDAVRNYFLATSNPFLRPS